MALLAKSHHILVDGVETVDLGQVLLDTTAERGHSARRGGASMLGGVGVGT